MRSIAAPSIYEGSHWNKAPENRGDLRLLSFNAYNYFNGDVKDGQVTFRQNRGPKNIHSYYRKRQALVSMINAIRPDVVLLQEVENDHNLPQPAIESLESAIDEVLPVSYIKFSHGGDVDDQAGQTAGFGTDEITQYILYRENGRLKPASRPLSYASNENGEGRPLIVQTFEYQLDKDTAFHFTVATSHLKSKRNVCGLDRYCSERRLSQASRMSQILKSLDDTGPIFWLGDFNSEPFEVTMRYLSEQSWKPLLGLSEYTYIFRGRKMLLDNALFLEPSQARYASLGLTLEMVASVWNIHNPAGGRESQADWMLSDHDPVIVDIKINEANTVKLGANAIDLNDKEHK